MTPEEQRAALFEQLVSEGILDESDRILWELLTPERALKMDAVLRQRTRHIAVLLEAVDDGHNQAAVLRSCEAFGVQNIGIVAGRGGWQPSQGVTQGADKWLSLHHYATIEEAIRAMQHRGYRVLASRLDEHATPIQDIDLRQPVALLFGNEHDGVSDEAVALADGTFIIPMYGFVQSLNISVAAAVSIFHTTQRARREVGDAYFLTPEERRAILRRWMTSNTPQARRVAAALRRAASSDQT